MKINLIEQKNKEISRKYSYSLSVRRQQQRDARQSVKMIKSIVSTLFVSF